MSLTTIADTLKSASGLATGADRAQLTALQISWPSFQNAANDTIPSETITVPATIPGSFTVNLEPSATGSAVPPFVYTVKYFFSDGSIQPDNWLVPASVSPQRVYQVHVSSGAVSSSASINLVQLLAGGANVGDYLRWNGSWGPATGSASEPINSQSGTSYTFLASDLGKLVIFTNSSAKAVVLPQATGSFGAGWFVEFRNSGAGLLTITPAVSTVDGAATLVIMQGQSGKILSDGTNYFVALKTMSGANTGTPSISAGTGAGTSPTISVAGNNILGTVTLTTGTLPAGSAPIATITFASPWPNAPVAVMGSPANAPIDWTTSATTLIFNAGPEGLLPSTAYSFTYLCFGG